MNTDTLLKLYILCQSLADVCDEKAIRQVDPTSADLIHRIDEVVRGAIAEAHAWS